MNLKIFFFLFFLALSCKESKRTLAVSDIRPQAKCERYIAYVKDNFLKDKQGYFYFRADSAQSISLQNGKLIRDCFKGMTKEDIRKIFGEPTNAFEDRFEYYMNERCNQKPYSTDINGCKRLTIYFLNGTVYRIPPLRVESGRTGY